MPNYFYRYSNAKGIIKDIYCIAYLIDGFFHTYKGLEFLNDIIARFILTLDIQRRILYPPNQDKQINSQIYKLKNFQNLKSLIKKPMQKNQMHGIFNNDDNIFWELKLWIEHNIKNAGGEGNLVCFDSLLNHALHFYTYKDKSTIKAKCRNIWNWYDKREWEYHILQRTQRSEKTKEEIKEIMQKRANLNSEIKAKKSRDKIIKAITLHANELKKKNGNWNIIKISKATNLSRVTVAKHLKTIITN